jgi:LysM repeat protein
VEHITSNKVRRGTRLRIRTGVAAVATPDAMAADSLKVAALAPPNMRSAASSSAASAMTVRVKAGDTLSALARRHGTTWRA